MKPETPVTWGHVVLVLGTAFGLVVGWFGGEWLMPKSMQGMVLGVLGGFLVAGVSSWLLRRSLPEAYSVAIIGFPTAGKTTLITSMFDEVWKGRIRRLSFKPLGESTIDRLNSDLATLKSGKPLEPTTDQDKFAYTTRVRVPRFLGNRWFKLEIGDFPGQDSRSFAKEFGKWIHKTPYFKWAVTADAFVFVVDVAKIPRPIIKDGEGGPGDEVNTDGSNYVAEISASLRAAWQHLTEHHEERGRGISRKPVVLAFAKADLLAAPVTNNPEYGSADSVGGVAPLPPAEELDAEELAKGQQYAVETFDDLVRYLDSECRRFRVVFVTSCGLHGGARVGVEKLLSWILPR